MPEGIHKAARESASSTLQPLLSYLLASCAPPAELDLKVTLDEGKQTVVIDLLTHTCTAGTALCVALIGFVVGMPCINTVYRGFVNALDPSCTGQTIQLLYTVQVADSLQRCQAAHLLRLAPPVTGQTCSST